jgi:hypothetical protein
VVVGVQRVSSDGGRRDVGQVSARVAVARAGVDTQVGVGADRGDRRVFTRDGKFVLIGRSGTELTCEEKEEGERGRSEEERRSKNRKQRVLLRSVWESRIRMVVVAVEFPPEFREPLLFGRSLSSEKKRDRKRVGKFIERDKEGEEKIKERRRKRNGLVVAVLFLVERLCERAGVTTKPSWSLSIE